MKANVARVGTNLYPPRPKMMLSLVDLMMQNLSTTYLGIFFFFLAVDAVSIVPLVVMLDD
jgi:hypothetical protein